MQAMRYIPPFTALEKKFRVVGGNGKKRIDMKYDDFIGLLKLMLRVVAVDEDWYRSHYPDVADAIKAGAYKSAKHHYVEDGFFEGRWPYEFDLDEHWYKSQYPDVVAGIKAGAFVTLKEHFREHGYKEGRLPTEY
jgi:hypothetical protein